MTCRHVIIVSQKDTLKPRRDNDTQLCQILYRLEDTLEIIFLMLLQLVGKIPQIFDVRQC